MVEMNRRGFLLGTAAGLSCARPPSAAYHVFVANEDSRSVAAVDLINFRVIKEIGIDGAPTAVVFMTKIGWNKPFLELFRSDLEEAREKLMRRARPLG